jgi:hypothetical protein
MRYPHRWRCVRASPGTQDPDTGAFVPASPTVIYDGPADVQDEGSALRRDAEGRAVEVSDAVVFLRDEPRAPLHRTGDRGEITWEDGAKSTAEVQKVVRLDGKLHLRWV